MVQCRILNVGPNLQARRLLQELVQTDEPVCLRHIETGFIALDQLARLPATELPHLVIVPSRLPILTGLDFIAQMQTHEHLRSIPVLVWGTEIPAAQIDEMQRIGVGDVFLGEFGTIHLAAIRRFVGSVTGVEGNVQGVPPPSQVTSRRISPKAKRDAKLGKLFAWAGCISTLLWLCTFIGRSYDASDIVPLPVYAALTCAGFLLMWNGMGEAAAPDKMS